jgi:hypothetical protein
MTPPKSSTIRDTIPAPGDNTEQRLRRLEYNDVLREANIDLLVACHALLVRCLPPPPAEILPLYNDVKQRLDEWERTRAEAAQHLYPHDEDTAPGVRRLRTVDGGDDEQ